MSKLRTVGGSVMFAIPKSLLETLGMHADASVGLSVADGKLVIDPHPKQHYTLAQLLAQCDPDAPPSAEDTRWLSDEAMGREEIV